MMNTTRIPNINIQYNTVLEVIVGLVTELLVVYVSVVYRK